MAYNRLPQTVIAGTALTQNPPPAVIQPAGIIPVTIDSNIASTVSLGVVQVGGGLSITPAGVLSATGSSLINVKLTNANYTALAADYYIGATTNGITITLPTGIVGKVYIVKNQVNGNITVTGTGQTINQSVSVNVGSEGSLILVFSGTRWNII